MQDKLQQRQVLFNFAKGPITAYDVRMAQIAALSVLEELAETLKRVADLEAKLDFCTIPKEV